MLVLRVTSLGLYDKRCKVEDQTEAHPKVWPGTAEESARFDERTLETRLYVGNATVLDSKSGSQIVCKMTLRVVQRWKTEDINNERQSEGQKAGSIREARRYSCPYSADSL